jgi:hypothetical protein
MHCAATSSVHSSFLSTGHMSTYMYELMIIMCMCTCTAMAWAATVHVMPVDTSGQAEAMTRVYESLLCILTSHEGIAHYECSSVCRTCESALIVLARVVRVSVTPWSKTFV